VCVCVYVTFSVCVCVCVAAGEEIDIRDAFVDTWSLNDWVNLFTNDDNDSDFEESEGKLVKK